MNFARAIRISRVAFGLRQADLARRAGIGASHLSLIESGQRQPSMATIQKLCRALDIPVDLVVMLATDPSEGKDVRKLSEALLRLLATARHLESD